MLCFFLYQHITAILIMKTTAIENNTKYIFADISVSPATIISAFVILQSCFPITFRFDNCAQFL